MSYSRIFVLHLFLWSHWLNPVSLTHNSLLVLFKLVWAEEILWVLEIYSIEEIFIFFIMMPLRIVYIIFAMRGFRFCSSAPTSWLNCSFSTIWTTCTCKVIHRLSESTCICFCDFCQRFCNNKRISFWIISVVWNSIVHEFNWILIELDKTSTLCPLMIQTVLIVLFIVFTVDYCGKGYELGCMGVGISQFWLTS